MGAKESPKEIQQLCHKPSDFLLRFTVSGVQISSAKYNTHSQTFLLDTHI